MARRKAKKPPTVEEDISMLLETPVPKPKKRTNSFVSPLLLFIITFTVGSSVMGWFLVQQQQSLDQLSESFTTIQQKITNFQQVMEMADTQEDTDLFVEDRIFALEQAQKEAWEKAEVALATTEKLKNSDVLSKLLELRSEMDTQWDEIQQAASTVTSLQAMFKNHSEEFEAIKERLVTSLSFSSALSEDVAGLNSAVTSVRSRIDEQVASMEVLNAQLEGQNSKLSDLKELIYLHNAALHTHTHEMDALKGIFKEKQVMRSQALDVMLGSVQMTLDEQFLTSQNLHSSIMAQLQTFHTQLANEPSWPIKDESNDESVSMTTQNSIEGDVQEEAEQLDGEDEAEEEAEEQPLEQEVDEDSTEETEKEEEEEEEEEEEVTPEVKEEEEITGQAVEEEEEEDVGETAEEDEEESEETIAGHVLDEALEEEFSEEEEEDLDSAEEESVSVETHEEEQM